MTGLVELAQRYVSLSAELEETRSAMRAALMNGSDGNPTTAGSSGPPNKGTDREGVLAQSKAADERVLALLERSQCGQARLCGRRKESSARRASACEDCASAA